MIKRLLSMLMISCTVFICSYFVICNNLANAEAQSQYLGTYHFDKGSYKAFLQPGEGLFMGISNTGEQYIGNTTKHSDNRYEAVVQLAAYDLNTGETLYDAWRLNYVFYKNADGEWMFIVAGCTGKGGYEGIVDGYYKVSFNKLANDTLYAVMQMF